MELPVMTFRNVLALPFVNSVVFRCGAFRGSLHVPPSKARPTSSADAEKARLRLRARAALIAIQIENTRIPPVVHGNQSEMSNTANIEFSSDCLQHLLAVRKDILAASRCLAAGAVHLPLDQAAILGACW